LLVLAGLTGCGGGGGGGGSSTAPSKLFVSDGANHAIGSLANSNPLPGTFAVDRIIMGSSTGLDDVGGTPSWSYIPSIALDAAGDRLYAATQIRVRVFDQVSVANGNVAPARTISATGVSFYSLFLDTTNNRLYVAGTNGYLYVFDGASTLNGAVSPTRTVLPDFGGVSVVGPFGIAVDNSKNMLYVGIYLNGSTSIMVFNNAGTINYTGTALAPDRTLSFSYAPNAFYLDSVNDRLYVALGNGQIQVFDSASTLASGTQTPNRTLSIAAQAIFVDTTNNRLYAVKDNHAYIVNGASTANDPVTATLATVSSTNSLFSGVAVKP
jgi:hypothetical protein